MQEYHAAVLASGSPENLQGPERHEETICSFVSQNIFAMCDQAKKRKRSQSGSASNARLQCNTLLMEVA